MRLAILPTLGFLSILLFTSCEKDNQLNDENLLPTTYNFENVDYSGQTARLDMLAEMTLEMKKADNGSAVDGAKLLSMFENNGSPFSSTDLNNSSKQLKNKCYDNVGAAYKVSTFEYYMNRLSSLSSTNASQTWSPGNPGVSSNGSKSYFFDEGGVEYTQIVEKGLMGAVFYYQMAETYTREDKIGNAVDNTTVTPGEGTPMEHHWDEAFGYFGAPKDLSGANIASKVASGDVRYHARYAEKGHDVGLNTADKVMNAFIKGRFAISTKDYDKRDEAAAELRREWELVIATTAIHYINGGISNFGDATIKYHALSEAYAFLLSLYYNSDKLISDTDLQTVRNYFEATPPGSPNSVPSFVQLTVADLNAAKNLLSTIYGLDSVKDNL